MIAMAAAAVGAVVAEAHPADIGSGACGFRHGAENALGQTRSAGHLDRRNRPPLQRSPKFATATKDGATDFVGVEDDPLR
jgi:hypothetical protein